jgi:hypothetical protein
MSKTTNDNFVGPLLSEAKLKELQEEYSIILYEIIEYITKNLGQSIERQVICEEHYKSWRKYSTKISIPKAIALEMGYGNDRFIVVRRAVNSKFHIYEEYEAEKDGVDQIIFLIEPKLILKPDKSNSNGKFTFYYKSISEEVKKYIRKLSKDQYEDLCEQIRINETIEVPIVLPEHIHMAHLRKYLKLHPKVFKNIAGFRRPHLKSESRKKGYNLYVKVTGLDF